MKIITNNMKTFEQFLTERLKSMDSFNKKVINILNKTIDKDDIKPKIGYGMTTIDIDTKFGKMSISLHTDKSEVYSIFMRFDIPKLALSDEEIRKDMNHYSGKWNIHTMEEGEALLLFTDRLNIVKK